ncbi:MAG: hypothetical protein PS018_08905 [bacterium]|nr:hypothetical protein [bacterium]
METEATCRGTVYPWQCLGDLRDHGVHMDRQACKSAPFAPAIRNTAIKHLEPEMA